MGPAKNHWADIKQATKQLQGIVESGVDVAGTALTQAAQKRQQNPDIAVLPTNLLTNGSTVVNTINDGLSPAPPHKGSVNQPGT